MSRNRLRWLSVYLGWHRHGGLRTGPIDTLVNGAWSIQSRISTTRVMVHSLRPKHFNRSFYRPHRKDTGNVFIFFVCLRGHSISYRLVRRLVLGLVLLRWVSNSQRAVARGQFVLTKARPDPELTNLPVCNVFITYNVVITYTILVARQPTKDVARRRFEK